MQADNRDLVEAQILPKEEGISPPLVEPTQESDNTATGAFIDIAPSIAKPASNEPIPETVEVDVEPVVPDLNAELAHRYAEVGDRRRAKICALDAIRYYENVGNKKTDARPNPTRAWLAPPIPSAENCRLLKTSTWIRSSC